MKFGYFLNKTSFVYVVWQLCHYNSVFAVFHRLDIGDSTDSYFATACSVSLFDATCSENYAACREIRSLYHIDKLINCGFFVLDIVVDKAHYGIYHFTQIVRWDIGCHTYRDSCGSVY